MVLGERTKIERSQRAARHGFQTHGWKALFPAQTLDTLPMAENAMGPVTIRERVISNAARWQTAREGELVYCIDRKVSGV